MKLIKKSDALRSDLNKRLFLLAQNSIDKAFRSDGEAVRVRRDFHCHQLFNKHYTELTIAELETACKSFELLLSETKKELASQNQLQMLRFYTISCALIYCKLDDLQVYDEETGELFRGDILRGFLKDKWHSKNNRLKDSVFRFLCNNWSNPKANKFLVEGGFKKYIKNEKSLYYEKLTPSEANYLIKRFSQIYMNANTDSTVKIAEYRVN